MKTKKEMRAAFTRVDLVVTIVMILLLGLAALPLRADYESDGADLVCRTNMRQLTRALHLYSMDWNELFPPNGNDASPGRIWVSGNVGFSNEATNTLMLSRPPTSLLADYLERNPRAFKCGADTSAVVMGGRPMPRARSVSMNNAVGTHPQNGRLPTDGFWLAGGAGHTANQRYRCYARLSDVIHPTPANLFVFIDEHPDSINDGLFGMMGPDQSQYQWIDWPAAYHSGGGAGLGMADGSTMIHRWVSPTATRLNPPSPVASLPDLLWLAARTSDRIVDAPR